MNVCIPADDRQLSGDARALALSRKAHLAFSCPLRRLATLVGATLFFSTLGCVRRELIITSDPPGALVYLNDQEVGRTPVTRPFTFYGNYDVVLRKDGYQTLKTRKFVLAPWWQWVPFDLPAELFPLTDHQRMGFVMTPASTQPADPDLMFERAAELRARFTSRPAMPAATQPGTEAGETTMPSTAPSEPAMPEGDATQPATRPDTEVVTPPVTRPVEPVSPPLEPPPLLPPATKPATMPG